MSGAGECPICFQRPSWKPLQTPHAKTVAAFERDQCSRSAMRDAKCAYTIRHGRLLNSYATETKRKVGIFVKKAPPPQKKDIVFFAVTERCSLF